MTDTGQPTRTPGLPGKLRVDVNIYVCSTVRHLFFALLRAAHFPSESHDILFFADYQNASLSGWNLASLPADTHVHEVRRESFRQRINARAGGRAAYFLAMRNLAAPALLREHILTVLRTDCPGLVERLQNAANPRLWLFNERNKMSRVLRLLVPRFAIIEDGESNYNFVYMPLWKRPLRWLLGRPGKHRSFGEDPRCTAVWVQNPEIVPAAVSAKARRIDFLKRPVVAALVAQVFGTDAVIDVGDTTAIVATQPLDMFSFVSVEAKVDIYTRVAATLRQHGYDVLFKLHPAENREDYAAAVDATALPPGKIPLEAMLVAAGRPPLVISLWSAAGLGFEDYCQRIKLIDTDPPARLLEWRRHPELLEEQLDAALSQAAPHAR